MYFYIPFIEHYLHNINTLCTYTTTITIYHLHAIKVKARAINVLNTQYSTFLMGVLLTLTLLPGVARTCLLLAPTPPF